MKIHKHRGKFFKIVDNEPIFLKISSHFENFQTLTKFFRTLLCVTFIFVGFYIRDGVSIRLKGEEVEKVQSIFISRLVANGLAAMTGLLAVDDEVLEVNSIEVTGKTLDQVFFIYTHHLFCT